MTNSISGVSTRSSGSSAPTRTRSLGAAGAARKVLVEGDAVAQKLPVLKGISPPPANRASTPTFRFVNKSSSRKKLPASKSTRIAKIAPPSEPSARPSSRSGPRKPNLPEVIEKVKSRHHLIQFGNNSGLIKQILRSHFPWISPMDPNHEFSDFDCFKKGAEKKPRNFKTTCASSVHLIWTQYKVQEILETLKANKKFSLKYNSTQELLIDRLDTDNDDGVVLFNHFEKNVYLVSKRGLCLSMWNYYTKYSLDPFESVPMTFPVRSTTDPMFKIFEKVYAKHAENGNCVWITKPGHCQNRGFGIRCHSQLEDIKNRIAKWNGKIMIIQKYMESPLLIDKRKLKKNLKNISGT